MGSYMLSRRLLLAASSAVILAPGLAYAQDVVSSTDTAVGELVVVGTRAAPRTRLETVAPVDVLSNTVLTQQATTELGQALANVDPSIDFPRSAAVDATDLVRPVSLRGLSPDQTLVLIDGIRGHTSALLNTNGSVGRGSSAFDLNTIPTVALDRVEVLRDGASALYGSDAIAGVVNLQLRQAREGGEATVSYGLYDTTVDASRTSYDRHDGKTTNVSGWQGFHLGSDGFVTVSADYLHRDPTQRSDLDIRVTPNAITNHFGDGEVDQYTAFVNAGAAINATWSAYGYAGYQHRDSTSSIFARLASNANNVASVYPNGFIPQLNIVSQDLNSAVGLKGAIAGWNVNTSLSYGGNQLQFRTANSINSTYGAASPTSFYDGKLTDDQLLANLDVTREFALSGGNTLNVDWGAEGRREGFQIQAGQVESYARGPLGANTALGSGAQGFQGFSPANIVDKHRDSVSLYGDLEAKLGDLSLGGAVRGEHYSDFGDTATGKLSARYDIDEHLAFRGSVSNGFRAPSLQQQYYTLTQPTIANIGGVATVVDTGTFPSTSPVATALGGKALKPEKSTNYSLGTVFRNGRFDLTVDAYYIQLRDELALSDNLGTGINTTAQITALLAPFNVTAARFFVNGLASDTQGVDAVAHYRVPTDGGGTFDFTLAGNYNQVRITKVPTSTGTVTVPALFGQQRIDSIEDGTPDHKVTAEADWRKNGFGVTLRATYYGSVTQPASSLVDYVQSGDKTIVDLEARAPLGGVIWAVGVNNLLDTYPNKVPQSNIVNYNNGASAFPYYSPFGFNGRFLYTRLSLKW
jgi:iron complex outermembrane receptor protein